MVTRTRDQESPANEIVWFVIRNAADVGASLGLINGFRRRGASVCALLLTRLDRRIEAFIELESLLVPLITPSFSKTFALWPLLLLRNRLRFYRLLKNHRPSAAFFGGFRYDLGGITAGYLLLRSGVPLTRISGLEFQVQTEIITGKRSVAIKRLMVALVSKVVGGPVDVARVNGRSVFDAPPLYQISKLVPLASLATDFCHINDLEGQEMLSGKILILDSHGESSPYFVDYATDFLRLAGRLSEYGEILVKAHPVHGASQFLRDSMVPLLPGRYPLRWYNLKECRLVITIDSSGVLEANSDKCFQALRYFRFKESKVKENLLKFFSDNQISELVVL